MRHTDQTLPVISPLDGTVLSAVPMSAPKDLDAAVRAAKIAFHRLEPYAYKRKGTGIVPVPAFAGKAFAGAGCAGK